MTSAPAAASTQQRVLRCRVAAGALVVPADQVAGTAQAEIAPPPPGAPPWCGGLAWIDGVLVTVLDFAHPAASQPPPRRKVHLVRFSGQPVAALVVEALGQWALATPGPALPAALRPPGWICAPTWLRSGISGGERLALLDVGAVHATLSVPAATAEATASSKPPARVTP
jgi:hypothetical protein